MKQLSTFVTLATGIAFSVATAETQPAKTFIPYSDAAPIFDALRADLLPAEFRDTAPANREALWSGWVSRRDAAIRARVEQGDEDSIIHLLLFGTTFTQQPPITEQELAGVVVQTSGPAAPAFVASPVLKARIDDFLAAVASPAANERLSFTRAVIEHHGMDPATAGGGDRIRRYLEERIAVVGRAERTSRLLDQGTELFDKLTIFRDRGLSTDTSIFIDFGIEQTLDAMKASGAIRAQRVRRVAIVGPGLDFVDKQNGYDFYPLQTIQPFAIVDSLIRLELADPANLQVSAFDLSPRVLQHLETARERARAGASYSVVLPRSLDRPWTSDLTDYWQRVGNWIGDAAARVPPAPPNAGRVEVRGVAIRPPAVLAVTPLDLNIVTERLQMPPGGEPFDLIVATNILLYYDVFEQSLAAVNMARLLRPGGFLLTNNRIFELPESPLSGVGYTDAVYMSLPGLGDAGDRIIWYQKQEPAPRNR
jgi:hypothetical protein